MFFNSIFLNNKKFHFMIYAFIASKRPKNFKRFSCSNFGTTAKIAIFFGKKFNIKTNQTPIIMTWDETLVSGTLHYFSLSLPLEYGLTDFFLIHLLILFWIAFIVSDLNSRNSELFRDLNFKPRKALSFLIENLDFFFS